MAVKLKNDPGYYSRPVTIDGSTFYIRELDDEVFKQVLTLAREVQQLGDVPSGDTVSVFDAAQAKLQDFDADRAVSIVKKIRESLDACIVGGVMKWDIPNNDCTAETVVLLPNMVKASLVREIMADTTLNTDEERFLAK